MAMFGFFKKKPPEVKRADPLEAFDQVIDSVERQGAEVRRSAATLLALRAELSRDQQRYEKRIAELELKLPRAEGDPKAETTLRRDLHEARSMLDRTQESWSQVEADSRLLIETAEALARQLGELKLERQSAKTRLSAGGLVTEAMKARAAQFERVMKLDAARDEVERAHALAELYREEA